MNFWTKLKKPIFILAPMEQVTDTVFREIVTSVGKPDVFFTEFVPVDALLSPKAQQKMLLDFYYTPQQRPLVAQIYGVDPEKFYKSAQLIAKLGFDGIDINMGCPVKNTIKQGSCSALIKNPLLAKEIIMATIKGSGNLPVSVKTRIGFGKNVIEEWVEALLSTPISALTIHLRTAQEMSRVPAHWEEIKKAVGIRKRLKSKTLIIGNGDVKSLSEAQEKVKLYGIDGVMIGRGIFGNIYLFNKAKCDIDITPQEKIALLVKHIELFDKTWHDSKNFEIMKKFVKCYVNNFEGSAAMREGLMLSRSLNELLINTKSLL